MMEAEDQTSSRILSAPSRFESNYRENMTKHDWNGMQSNIALYFISESIFSTHFVEHLTNIHVQVQGFGTLKFHGSRYSLCICMLLK